MSESEESTATAGETQADDGPSRTQGARPVVDHTVCLCAGLGPLLTQTLRTLTVPEEVKRTVHETEREGLRLLRTLIDMRLSSLGNTGAPGAPASPDDSRGTKLDVE
jgi:hypothetical protein